LWTSSVFANIIDHFWVEMISKSDKISWDKFYLLEIKALDRDGNIVTDYEGTILIFSESDKKAKFSKKIKDNSYIFYKENKWKILFENWVKF